MKSTIVFVIGVFVLAEGILFALQGAGLVAWPRSSFMINDRGWIERGIVVALIGVGLILTAWRLQKKP
jgi:hypothetical protein